MDDGLFRKEALESRRRSPLGEASLPDAWSRTLLACFALVSIAVLGALLFGVDVPRRATVRGFIVPDAGLASVRAPQAAVVTAVEVGEGARVRAGDVLVRLSSAHGTRGSVDVAGSAAAGYASLRDALEARQRLESSTAAAERGRLFARISGARAEAEQVRAQLATARARERLADEQAARLATGVASGALARNQATAAELQSLQLRGEAQALQRQADALERDGHDLRAELALVELRTTQQRLATRVERTRLEQEATEASARREVVLRAPFAGSVTAIVARPGVTVRAAEQLLVVLPADAVFQARLLVPSRAVGFISPGQRVAIRLEAFPYQRFGVQRGRVTEVASGVVLPGELDLPLRLDEPAYPVLVALDSEAVRAYGRRWPLRPGLVFDADVELERTPLYLRLLDPLRSLGTTAS